MNDTQSPLHDAFNSVDTINNEILEQGKDGEIIPTLSLETDGTDIRVIYLGLSIWNTCDDVRVQDDEEGYVPLELFLRKQMKNLVTMINKYPVKGE